MSKTISYPEHKNYKVDLEHWKALRERYLRWPSKGPSLRVLRGSIIDGPSGPGAAILARFCNEAEAIRILKLAGFHEDGDFWKA